MIPVKYPSLLCGRPSIGDFGLMHLVQALAQPCRFFLLVRMQSAFAGLDETGRGDVQSLMDELELAPFSVAINLKIARHDNLEVWQ